MAVVVIGGVISSTLLTLVLVPVVYTYLTQLETAAKGFRWSLRRAAVKAPAPIGGGSNGGATQS